MNNDLPLEISFRPCRLVEDARHDEVILTKDGNTITLSMSAARTMAEFLLKYEVGRPLQT